MYLTSRAVQFSPHNTEPTNLKCAIVHTNSIHFSGKFTVTKTNKDPPSFEIGTQ